MYLQLGFNVDFFKLLLLKLGFNSYAIFLADVSEGAIELLCKRVIDCWRRRRLLGGTFGSLVCKGKGLLLRIEVDHVVWRLLQERVRVLVR
jgi:hypothetical protein